MLPVPPLVPIDLPTCRPALRRILSVPDTEYVHLYEHTVVAIMLVARDGCFISMDKHGRGGYIVISKKSIATYALQVLLLCQDFGQGGWTHIDGNDDWIVDVSGTS